MSATGALVGQRTSRGLEVDALAAAPGATVAAALTGSGCPSAAHPTQLIPVANSAGPKILIRFILAGPLSVCAGTDTHPGDASDFPAMS